MRITAKIRDRGTTPRGMKRAYNNASKRAWFDTAVRFHTIYRDRRFTEAHAEAAGYGKRKGEMMTRGTAAFNRSYTGRKLRLFGHTRALEFSGATRNKVRAASISSTNKSGKAAYPGASKFNFQHPRSRLRLSDEFTRVLPNEAQDLGEYYDHRLEIELAKMDQSG